MTGDPKRLRDMGGDAFDDLRDAVVEAQTQTPDAGWQQRMTERLQKALEASSHDEAPDSEYDPERRDRPEPEPPPLEPDPDQLEVTGEASVREPTKEVAEADVTAGLTAGLLAAGAAASWLRRRATRPPEEDQ